MLNEKSVKCWKGPQICLKVNNTIRPHATSFNIWDLIGYLRPFSAFDTCRSRPPIRRPRPAKKVSKTRSGLNFRHVIYLYATNLEITRFWPLSCNVVTKVEALFSIWDPSFNMWDLYWVIWDPFQHFDTIFGIQHLETSVIWGPFQHLRPSSFNIWDIIGYIWDPFQHLTPFWRTQPPIVSSTLPFALLSLICMPCSERLVRLFLEDTHSHSFQNNLFGIAEIWYFSHQPRHQPFDERTFQEFREKWFFDKDTILIANIMDSDCQCRVFCDRSMFSVYFCSILL